MMSPGGYQLFFNRDERHGRAQESPPELSHANGVAFIAPRDGDHGGTWVLANEYGLTFCLLNDYGQPLGPAPEEPRLSRGHLVRACAAATSLRDAAALVRRQPLARAPAFQLVGVAADGEPLVLHWNGTTLARRTLAGVPALLTSSSFSAAEVIAARRDYFAQSVRLPLWPEATELDSFHRGHGHAPGSHSVLMCRPDAATRSITRVVVRCDRVDLRYEPVRWAGGKPTVLAPAITGLARRHLARDDQRS